MGFADDVLVRARPGLYIPADTLLVLYRLRTFVI